MMSQQQDQGKTLVQLTLHARRLKNVAGAFKGTSDPYCVVTQLASDPQDHPAVLGKTEVIKNSLNPSWTTAFQLEYEFGKPTRVNVGIYDEVKKSKKHKPMGSALFEIGEILGSRGNVKAKSLKSGGVLYARVERAAHRTGETLHLSLQGIKLKNVDGLFSKSDPFFEISKRLDAVAGGHSWEVVYRSKPIMNNLNPKWEPVSIAMDRVCDGNPSKPILISVYDWEKNGRHNAMGFFETSVNGLKNARIEGNLGNASNIDTSKAFELKRRGKSFGKIIVTAVSVTGENGGPNLQGATQQHSAPVAPPPMAVSAAHAPVAPPPMAASAANAPPFSMALETSPPMNNSYMTIPSAPSNDYDSMPIGYNIPTPAPPPSRPSKYGGPAVQTPQQQRPNFVDYVSGGCELQMCVAIDFTGSNGDPRRPGTLHYIHRDGQLNDYEKALTAVGAIVAKYDSDQKFPVWGFGAKYGGILRNCFQVGPHAELSGIGAILEGYRGVFKTAITLSGPTVFTEVIQTAAAQARAKQEQAQRFGQQAYTILLILTDGAVTDVNATMAAIRAASDAPLSIVIVGIGNADFSAMQFLDDFQQQEVGSGRDICQFVEFRRHQHNKISLTQATLDEIPDQLVDYFYGRGIMPLPAVSGSQFSLVPDDYNADEDVDLSLDLKEDGDISLVNSSQGLYDDTGFGDIATYSADIAVLPPPPTAPNAPYNPAAASATAPYNPSAPGAQPYNPSSMTSMSAQQASQMPSAPYNSAPYNPSSPPRPPAQASVVAQPVFHVQLPPGVSSGMQIQVQNPSTHQNMIVTVPDGVPPGGTFAVQY